MKERERKDQKDRKELFLKATQNNYFSAQKITDTTNKQTNNDVSELYKELYKVNLFQKKKKKSQKKKEKKSNHDNYTAPHQVTNSKYPQDDPQPDSHT